MSRSNFMAQLKTGRALLPLVFALNLCFLCPSGQAGAQAGAQDGAQGVAWSELAADLERPDELRARRATETLLSLDPFGAIQVVMALRSRSTNQLVRWRCERVARGALATLLDDASKPILQIPGCVAAAGGGLGVFYGLQIRADPSRVAENDPNAENPQDKNPQDPINPINPGDPDPENPDPWGPKAGPTREELAAEQEAAEREALAKALRARSQLIALGPTISAWILATPPLRGLDEQRKLWAITVQIYDELAARMIATPEKAEACLDEFAWNFDLTAPILAMGLRDQRESLRRSFQSFRERRFTELCRDLPSADYQKRQLATEMLFQLGELSKVYVSRLAKPSIEAKSAKAGSPESGQVQASLRLEAIRLEHRLRFHISESLIEKLGSAFDDYDSRSFHERRELILDLERLGGQEAIPCLRALLRQEPSRSLQTLAALSLARLGDPIGILRLQQEGFAERLAVPKSDLIAIFMDQGIKYLTIGRFQQAEREFLRVLELEPRNETALYNLACTYSLWGRSDEAIEMLRRAIDAGFDDLSHIEKDPDLDAIRVDPRVRTMLDKLRARQSSGEGAR